MGGGEHLPAAEEDVLLERGRVGRLRLGRGATVSLRLHAGYLHTDRYEGFISEHLSAAQLAALVKFFAGIVCMANCRRLRPRKGRRRSSATSETIILESAVKTTGEARRMLSTVAAKGARMSKKIEQQNPFVYVYRRHP